MVGLNHEMGRAAALERLPDRPARQLLPPVLGRARLRPHARRSRPIRTSCESSSRTSREIHRWTHELAARRRTRTGRTSGTGRLVLLVRGELLRRYPNADVYAARRVIDANGKESLGEEERHPLFRGTLAPDITFFGFALDEDDGARHLRRPERRGLVLRLPAAGVRSRASGSSRLRQKHRR